MRVEAFASEPVIWEAAEMQSEQELPPHVLIDWSGDFEPGQRLVAEFQYHLGHADATPEIRMLLDEELDQTGWSERPQAQFSDGKWIVRQAMRLVGRYDTLLPGFYSIELMVRMPGSAADARGYQAAHRFRLRADDSTTRRRFELEIDDSVVNLEDVGDLWRASDVKVKVSKSALQNRTGIGAQVAKVLADAPPPPASVCARVPLASVKQMPLWEFSRRGGVCPAPAASTGAVTTRVVTPGETAKSDSPRLSIKMLKSSIHLTRLDAGLGDADLLRLREVVSAADCRRLSLRLPQSLAEFGHLRFFGLELRCLDLSRTRITDRGLDQVGALEQLWVLELSETGVTDAGLGRLRKLGQLRTLKLAGTAVSDAAIAALSALPGLEQLVLDRTPITDDGLLRLGELPKLTALSVRCCSGVTPHGRQVFATRHPRVMFDH